MTAVQRVNSDFKLNPHLHIIALDGVFMEQLDGAPPEFGQLPHLTFSEVADLVTTIRIRVLALLTRRGLIEDSTDQLVLLPDERAEDEPVLAQVTAAAATGLPPAGPERRQREPLRLARTPRRLPRGWQASEELGTSHRPSTSPMRVHLALAAILSKGSARVARCPPVKVGQVQLTPGARDQAATSGAVAVRALPTREETLAAEVLPELAAPERAGPTRPSWLRRDSGTGGGGGTSAGGAGGAGGTGGSGSVGPPTCDEEPADTIWAFSADAEGWIISSQQPITYSLTWQATGGTPSASGILQLDATPESQSAFLNLPMSATDYTGRIFSLRVYVAAGTDVGLKVHMQSGTTFA